MDSVGVNANIGPGHMLFKANIVILFSKFLKKEMAAK